MRQLSGGCSGTRVWRALLQLLVVAACSTPLLAAVPQVGQAASSPSHKSKSSAPVTKARIGVAARTTATNGSAGSAGKTAGPAAAKTTVARSQVKAVRLAPAPAPSVAQLAGLHRAEDELALRSAVALVVDRETDEVLFSKNSRAVLPIASITKLMTALVVVEAGLPLDEDVVIGADEVRATASSYSRKRLLPGTTLTRGELLRLALMASDNRAAHALGRSFPGGVTAFVAAMNARARLLGMQDTRYVEPTGLSSDNRSSAEDLARLVRAAGEHPVIAEYSTTADAVVTTGRRQVQFRNTNALVGHPDWDIAVQKTGYTAAAGRCVVMQARLAGRPLVLVLLDAAGRHARVDDAERLRQWLLEVARAAPAPADATASTTAPDVPRAANDVAADAPAEPAAAQAQAQAATPR